ARSGMESTSVPSRSIITALTRSGNGIFIVEFSPLLDPGERGAHRRDRRLVVLRAEDRRAGDDRIGARPRGRLDVLALDRAVDFDPDVAARGPHPLAHRGELL